MSLAIDLGIATFCVLAIIPYLSRVNGIMKYEGGIAKLSVELSEAIDSDHKATASNRINELVKLGINAADEMREHEISEIFIKLTDGINKVVDKKWYTVTLDIMQGLFNISIRAIDNNLSDGTVSLSSFCLHDIGIKLAEKKSRFIPFVIDYIGEIANSAYKKDREKFIDTTEYSMIHLWMIGSHVQKYSPELAKEMVLKLKKSDKLVIRDLFGSERIRKLALEEGKELMDELKAFEELYNNQML